MKKFVIRIQWNEGECWRYFTLVDDLAYALSVAENFANADVSVSISPIRVERK